MAGAYAQSEIEWTRALRTTVGLRADVYQFSVTVGQPAELGHGHRRRSSVPKLGAILGPWSGTELYVNAGGGFHSNDARGATITRRSRHRRAGRSGDAAGAREGR